MIKNKQSILTMVLQLLLVAPSYQSTNAQLLDRKFFQLDKIKYQIEYEQIAYPDSTDLDFVRGGIMLLNIGDSISLYLGRSLFVVDTLTRKMKSLQEVAEFANQPNTPRPGSLYRIYKNYRKREITSIEPVITDTYKYSEPSDAFNWTIEEAADTIRKYKVQKATCRFGGRDWVAWFCADIPINDGPYKFCGLPGLIVKLNDTRDYYTYTLQKIEIPEQSIFIDFQDRSYIESTKEGFFEARRLLLENSLTILKEAGAASNTMQTAARNIAKKNNPIELNVD